MAFSGFWAIILPTFGGLGIAHSELLKPADTSRSSLPKPATGPQGMLWDAGFSMPKMLLILGLGSRFRGLGFGVYRGCIGVYRGL